jgi:hypothetical protein
MIVSFPGFETPTAERKQAKQVTRPRASAMFGDIAC